MIGRDIEERIGRCLITMEQLRAELMTIWKAIEVPGMHTDEEMHMLRGRAFTGYVEASKILREVVALAGDLGCVGASVTITLDGPGLDQDPIKTIQRRISDTMDRHKFRTHPSVDSKCLVCGELFNHKIHRSPEGNVL